MFYLKKYIWIIIIVLLVIVFIIFNKDSEEIQLEEEIIKTEENILEEEKIVSEIVKVDIKGAVKNPGVYEVDENSRVSDVIEISGGLTNEADTSVINLSKNVIDEMVIIIYTKDEIEEMKKGSTSIKYIEKECICPKLENDACIENSIDNVPDNNSSSTNGKISLNNASIDELMTLEGISEKKAQAIIEYRKKHSFKSIEELLEVDGIGTTTYEKIKDRLTI